MLRAGRDAPAEAIGGLSAFPLTPLTDATVDEPALGRIVERLNHGRVDSITVLGSTGVGVYLDRAQQQRVVEVAVAAAGGVPVIAGISSLTTRDVLHRAAAAERAGAAALLLAPVSYHPLTEHEVHGLYADVAAEVSLPIVVYDNPTTTGFTFTDDLSARITALPRIASVKIPPVAGGLDDARTRISTLRAQLPRPRQHRHQRRRRRSRRSARRSHRLVLRACRAPSPPLLGHPAGHGARRRRPGTRALRATGAALGAVRPARQPARGLLDRRRPRAGRPRQSPASTRRAQGRRARSGPPGRGRYRCR